MYLISAFITILNVEILSKTSSEPTERTTLNLTAPEKGQRIKTMKSEEVVHQEIDSLRKMKGKLRNKLIYPNVDISIIDDYIEIIDKKIDLLLWVLL